MGKLINEIQKATKDMSDHELAKFKRELKRRIPGVVHYAAEKSRTKSDEEKEGE